ncbi:ATP-binding protein [Streptomyces sp. p1417]|uniref:ATP-binding protein n=1 Tax=Streptomyces typhae TaxID=2681492 RepID=A0A6L6WNK7_9ACTN|nr:ATP-binding protein [Streptomyces typhae]
MTTDEGEVILRWPRHPRSVSRARQELRKNLADWGAADLEDAALVVLSELLTNAVRHARASHGREIETRFRRLESDRSGGSDGSGGSCVVRIEVHDSDAELPVVRPYGPCADGGRGLPIVAALAERWGVTPRNGPGKQVWAELRAPTA